MRYQVGDWVRVREWDDMAAEFGTYWDAIDTPRLSFLKEMAVLCGETFEIERVHKGASCYNLSGIKGMECGGYGFTDDMLTDAVADCPGYSEDDFMALLGVT